MRPWEDVAVPASTARVVREMLDSVYDGPLSEATLLDFGAGNGRYIDVFKEWFRDNNIIAAEVDPESLRVLQTKGVRTLELNAARASFQGIESESVHVVFSSNVLEHIPVRLYEVYLAEIARVLRPDGVFLVGMPNYPYKRLYDLIKAATTPKYRRYYLFDDPTHVNKISIRRFETDLCKHFSSIHLKPGFGPIQPVADVLGIDSHHKWLSRFCDKYFGYAMK